MLAGLNIIATELQKDTGASGCNSPSDVQVQQPAERDRGDNRICVGKGKQHFLEVGSVSMPHAVRKGWCQGQTGVDGMAAIFESITQNIAHADLRDLNLVPRYVSKDGRCLPKSIVVALWAYCATAAVGSNGILPRFHPTMTSITFETAMGPGVKQSADFLGGSRELGRLVAEEMKKNEQTWRPTLVAQLGADEANGVGGNIVWEHLCARCASDTQFVGEAFTRVSSAVLGCDIVSFSAFPTDNQDDDGGGTGYAVARSNYGEWGDEEPSTRLSLTDLFSLLRLWSIITTRSSQHLMRTLGLDYVRM